MTIPRLLGLYYSTWFRIILALSLLTVLLFVVYMLSVPFRNLKYFYQQDEIGQEKLREDTRVKL